jgi:hypothetical protein
VLYGHVPAAAAIFASYYFQRRERYGLADLFGALASALEFPVFLLFVVLLAYRPRSSWRLRSIGRLLGVLVACFIPQLLHNWAAFGNPLTMGYSLEASQAFQRIHEGLFGFTWPKPATAYIQLLSAERGLLFYMPWAALGFIGFFRGRKFGKVLRNDPRPVAVAIFLLLFSTTYARSGGWAFGPRYLIPVIPLLASGLEGFAGDSKRHRTIVMVLLFPAILQALLGLYGEIHQPIHPVERPVPLPQISIGLRMMLDGHHSVWLTGLAGSAMLSLLALMLWVRGLLRFRFSRAIPLAIACWLLLALPSVLSDWGGKVSYYRGILAQHRGEYSLAAEYYFEAAEDPTAPPEVLERALYCQANANHTQD